jgi:streptomycin 6-kinase
MEGELAIPPKLAATVVSWTGDAGRAWLDDLPLLVDEVVAIWDLEVGPPYEPGGQISWVAPARRRGAGVDLVLKVQLPHPESAPEAAGLQAWDGDGAVRLHDHDPLRAALLVERCTPGLELVELGGTDDAVVAGAVLGARLHAAVIPEGLPTLASVLDTWADELEERLAQPYVDPGLARLAVDTMRTRPGEGSHEVLLHGDLNPTNVLSAERSPWLAIDPKPMVGDPAYDGPRLVTQPDPLATADAAGTLARRLDLVSEAMSLDRGALAVWCLVDSVEIGASARSHGDDGTAARRATLVDLIAAHLP